MNAVAEAFARDAAARARLARTSFARPDRCVARERKASPLTPVELSVLALVANGLTNNEVGDRLHRSPETVKMHVKNVREKLGAKDRTHAAVLAVRQGLIT